MLVRGREGSVRRRHEWEPKIAVVATRIWRRFSENRQTWEESAKQVFGDVTRATQRVCRTC